MALESITAKRRLAAVAAHFPATDPASSTASLAPLNCSSSSLNSVIRRCDNKISFARQASSEQGFFMRPAASINQEENNSGINLNNSVIRRGDNRLNFARQASSAQGFFMRPASTLSQEAPAIKCSAETKTAEFISSSEQPLLSKPEYAPPRFSKPAKDDFYFSSILPQQQNERPKTHLPTSANLGTDLSPRSDVAEFEHNYVVAVELPGASINDIRVEVDNINLTVTGRRTSICRKAIAGTAYLKQEIIQGPFKVSWPLPNNVDKDNVSAEFMDGLLRIVIPKL